MSNSKLTKKIPDLRLPQRNPNDPDQYWAVMFAGNNPLFRTKEHLARLLGGSEKGWYLVKYRDKLLDVEYHFAYYPDPAGGTVVCHYVKK